MKLYLIDRKDNIVLWSCIFDQTWNLNFFCIYVYFNENNSATSRTNSKKNNCDFFFPAARIREFWLVYIYCSTCTCINILIHNYSSLFNFLNYHQVMIPNLTVIHASVIRQSILLDTINRKPVMTIKYNYNRTHVQMWNNENRFTILSQLHQTS